MDDLGSQNKLTPEIAKVSHRDGSWIIKDTTTASWP